MLSSNSCKTANKSIPSLTKQTITFGKGGGFTGEVKEFIIDNSGKVYSKNVFTKQQKEIKNLTLKETKELFAKVENLFLNKEDFNHPGNIYYYIIYNNGKKNVSYKWGDNNFKTDSETESLYKELEKVIKK